MNTKRGESSEKRKFGNVNGIFCKGWKERAGQNEKKWWIEWKKNESHGNGRATIHLKRNNNKLNQDCCVCCIEKEEQNLNKTK